MICKLRKLVSEISWLSQGCEHILEKVNLTIDQFCAQIPVNTQEEDHQTRMVAQFRKLFQVLYSRQRLCVLNDENHRKLLIQFMLQESIEQYKYSYYNRAKLTQKHLKFLREENALIFSEAVMIASKLNIINKNQARNFTEDHLYAESQSEVSFRIWEILKLCDEKKRSVNNNFHKLQMIIESPNKMEVIKQLSKMLRQSWAKDKSKVKNSDVVLNPSAIQKCESVKQPVQEQQISDLISVTSSKRQIKQDSKSISMSMRFFKQKSESIASHLFQNDSFEFFE